MKRKLGWAGLTAAAIVLAAICIGAGSSSKPEPQGWMSAEQVTPARLKTLCTAQKWEVTDVEGGLRVEARVVDTQKDIFIIIWDEDKKLISLAMLYKLKEGVPQAKKLEVVNDFNNGIVFTRALINDGGDLELDYALRYANGLSEAQVTDAIRYFVHSTIYGLNQKAKDLMQ